MRPDHRERVGPGRGARSVQVLEGGQLGEYGGLQSDKQFRAIKKTCTSLVAEGRRVRVRRKGGTTLNPCAVRALRNGQEWGWGFGR